MGKSGIITEEYKGQKNKDYHNIAALFKIYRAVNWRMQIKINQVKHRFQLEYGTDVDSLLDSMYQAGMDINQDLSGEKENVEEILDNLEPHFPNLTRIHKATYFRWREKAFEAVSGIL